MEVCVWLSEHLMPLIFLNSTNFINTKNLLVDSSHFFHNHNQTEIFILKVQWLLYLSLRFWSNFSILPLFVFMLFQFLDVSTWRFICPSVGQSVCPLVHLSIGCLVCWSVGCVFFTNRGNYMKTAKKHW